MTTRQLIVLCADRKEVSISQQDALPSEYLATHLCLPSNTRLLVPSIPSQRMLLIFQYLEQYTAHSSTEVSSWLDPWCDKVRNSDTLMSALIRDATYLVIPSLRSCCIKLYAQHLNQSTT